MQEFNFSNTNKTCAVTLCPIRKLFLHKVYKDFMVICKHFTSNQMTITQPNSQQSQFCVEHIVLSKLFYCYMAFKILIVLVHNEMLIGLLTVTTDFHNSVCEFPLTRSGNIERVRQNAAADVKTGFLITEW